MKKEEKKYEERFKDWGMIPQILHIFMVGFFLYICFYYTTDDYMRICNLSLKNCHEYESAKNIEIGIFCFVVFLHMLFNYFNIKLKYAIRVFVLVDILMILYIGWFVVNTDIYKKAYHVIWGERWQHKHINQWRDFTIVVYFIAQRYLYKFRL